MRGYASQSSIQINVTEMIFFNNFVLSIKSTTYSIENIDFPAGTQYGLAMQGLKCFISFLQYYLVLKENCNLIISDGEPVLFSLPLGSGSWEPFI